MPLLLPSVPAISDAVSNPTHFRTPGALQSVWKSSVAGNAPKAPPLKRHRANTPKMTAGFSNLSAAVRTADWRSVLNNPDFVPGWTFVNVAHLTPQKDLKKA